MGIETKTNKWDENKLKILKDNYTNMDWDILLKLLHPFSKDDIIHKAYTLNLKRNNYYYSQEEINLIKKYYTKLSVSELKNMLPNRSEQSIMVKANKLGIISRERWSEEEIEILINYYKDETNFEVQKYLSNRSLSAIQCMAGKLGLNKTYSKREFTNEYLIFKLKCLAKTLNRTPTFWDFADNDIPSIRSYSRYFGNYKNACDEAGLDWNDNFNRYINIFYSLNGDTCYSSAELFITNFFIENNINYKKEFFYKDIINDERCGLKRCDWLINNNIICEYFGLMHLDNYKIKTKEKISICEDNNISMICLYPSDLKFNKLKNIFLHK